MGPASLNPQSHYSSSAKDRLQRGALKGVLRLPKLNSFPFIIFLQIINRLRWLPPFVPVRIINDPDLFDSLLSCVKWFKNKEMLDMFNPTSLN